MYYIQINSRLRGGQILAQVTSKLNLLQRTHNDNNQTLPDINISFE